MVKDKRIKHVDGDSAAFDGIAKSRFSKIVSNFACLALFLCPFSDRDAPLDYLTPVHTATNHGVCEIDARRGRNTAQLRDHLQPVSTWQRRKPASQSTNGGSRGCRAAADARRSAILGQRREGVVIGVLIGWGREFGRG